MLSNIKAHSGLEQYAQSACVFTFSENRLQSSKSANPLKDEADAKLPCYPWEDKWRRESEPKL